MAPPPAAVPPGYFNRPAPPTGYNTQPSYGNAPTGSYPNYGFAGGPGAANTNNLVNGLSNLRM